MVTVVGVRVRCEREGRGGEELGAGGTVRRARGERGAANQKSRVARIEWREGRGCTGERGDEWKVGGAEKRPS